MNTNFKQQMIALNGSQVSSASINRSLGLRKALKEHPEIQLNQLVFTNWSPKIAFKKTLKQLNRYPNTRIIWASSDQISMASQEATKENIITGGIDWSPKGIKAIKNKRILASYGGHFVEAGLALVLLHDYYHGQDFINDLGVKIATQMSKLDKTSNNQYNKDNFQSINFKRLSKIYNNNLDQYDFSRANIWQETAKQ